MNSKIRNAESQGIQTELAEESSIDMTQEVRYVFNDLRNKQDNGNTEITDEMMFLLYQKINPIKCKIIRKKNGSMYFKYNGELFTLKEYRFIFDETIDLLFELDILQFKKA